MRKPTGKAESIHTVSDGKRVLALIYKNVRAPKGARFLTPISYPLQVGLHEYTKKRTAPLHQHPDFKYPVNTTQEFIYVEKGTVTATITNKRWKIIETHVLKRGDFILTIDGGHAYTFSRGSRVIEVKQGPYPGDAKAKIYYAESAKNSG